MNALRTLGAYPAMVALFLAMSLALTVVIAKAARWDRERAGRPALLLLGTGPLLTGWIVGMLLTLAPGRPPVFYLGVTAALPLLVLLLAPRRAGGIVLAAVGGIEQAFGRTEPRERVATTLLLTAAIAVSGVTVYQASTRPLDRSDPLEYATVGRIVARNLSHANYPFEHADPATNYFWPSTHPLLYVDAIAATYWVQGTDLDFGAAKVITPFCYLALLAALVAVVLPRGPVAAAAAVFLAAASPGLVELTKECHIDPLLMYAFFAAVMWPATVGVSVASAAAHGVLIGLAMNVHSIGALALPFGLAASAAIAGRVSPQVMRHALVAGAIAAALGAWPYLDNALTTGRTVGNAVLAGTTPGIDQARWIAAERGLGSLVERVVFGVLRPWTSPIFFGILPWMALAGVATAVSRRREFTADARAAAVTCALFLLMFLAAALMNRVGPIQNYRYQMALVPLMVVLALPAVERWLESRW